MSRERVPGRLRQRVAAQARHRCGYGLNQTAVVGELMALDHIIPVAAGGETVEANLWLACRACNGFKLDRTSAADPATGEIVPLFNPRRQRWSEHFTWTDDGTTIVGLTATGRATVEVLHLNRPWLVRARRRWVAAGWHPPED